MTRSDGRLSQGMEIATAISARAWNRAQDAADIVLRSRMSDAKPQGVAPASLVILCNVGTTEEGVAIGHVVRIGDPGAVVVPESTIDSVSPEVRSMTGEVIKPVSIDNYPDAKVPLGVIVGGPVMPTPGNAKMVRVCIAGMCVARVRPRTSIGAAGGVGHVAYLQGPVLRVGDDESELVGAAEACSCGTHRIIKYLGLAPESESVRFAVVML